MKAKKFTLTELIAVIVFLGIILFFILIIILGFKVYKGVSQDGLKKTIEKVWEGPASWNTHNLYTECAYASILTLNARSQARLRRAHMIIKINTTEKS